MSYSSQLGYIVKDVAVNNIESVGGSRDVSGVGSAGIISASTTLTAADSGCVFGVNTTAAVVVSLPAPKAGLHFRFVISTAAANTLTVSSTGANMLVHRHATHDTIGAAGGTLRTSVILGADTAPTVGDSIEVFGVNSSTYFAVATAVVDLDMTVA